jgi:cell division protein ZapE
VTTDPQTAYRAKLASGEIQADPVQELAVEKLEILHHRLIDYRPGRNGGGLLSLLGFAKKQPVPEGLYLYGGVGRGKSMLMDLFFDGAPVEHKRRVHFHAFMLEVHKRIHRWRAKTVEDRTAKDPIPPLAAKLAEEAWLLCFDEFEVRDVADAMILGRLFSQLFELGVVVVATSNRAPDDLYAGGLNRPLFLPFIALMKEKLDVLHLEGAHDYRIDRLKGQRTFFTPVDATAARELDAAFLRLTDQPKGEPETLAVMGRQVPIREAAKGVARASFGELCEAALGPADYLALAAEFHTLILNDVPQLSPAKRNEARRFVMLIDVLYEHRVKLVASAAAPPESLYPQGDGSFEFARTVSRLNEMQSADYIAADHKAPQDAA